MKERPTAASRSAGIIDMNPDKGCWPEEGYTEKGPRRDFFGLIARYTSSIGSRYAAIRLPTYWST